MATGFSKAVRTQQKLRAAIDGPSGAGKTFTTLRLAFAMRDAGLVTRVAVIDSEDGSSQLYAGESPDGRPWEFDVLTLRRYSPEDYTTAMQMAFKEGFDCVVIDSLSHAWIGEGGALDIVDKKDGNKFTAWKDVTPLHRKMVDTIVRAPAHVLVTMRSKTEYVIEEDDKGKKIPRKIGMAPIQRDGMEYEFTVYGSMDWSHQLKISKTRCNPMDGATSVKPGPGFWAPLFDWLKTAAVAAPGAKVAAGLEPVTEPVPKSAPAPAPATSHAENGHASGPSLFLQLRSMIEAMDVKSMQATATSLKGYKDRLTPEEWSELKSLFDAKKKEVAADSKSVA